MAIRRFSFIGHFRIRYYCITNIYLNLSIYFNALLGRLDIQTMLKRSTDWNVWEAIFFGCDHTIQHVYIWKLRFLYARFKFKKKLSVSAKKILFALYFVIKSANKCVTTQNMSTWSNYKISLKFLLILQFKQFRIIDIAYFIICISLWKTSSG